MSIQFNFRADSITFKRPGDINFASSNSSVIMTTNPVVEPIPTPSTTSVLRVRVSPATESPK